MGVELIVEIPPWLAHVNLVAVSLQGRHIGYVNHVLEQIDGDTFLCNIDVFSHKEEFVRKIIR